MSLAFGSGTTYAGYGSLPTLSVTPMQPIQPMTPYGSTPTASTVPLSTSTSSNLQQILNQIPSINNGYGSTGSTGPSAWLPGVYSDVLTAAASAPQITYNVYQTPSGPVAAPTVTQPPLQASATQNVTSASTPSYTSQSIPEIPINITPVTNITNKAAPQLPSFSPFNPTPLAPFNPVGGPTAPGKIGRAHV